jgi:hypothetical protein
VTMRVTWLEENSPDAKVYEKHYFLHEDRGGE